MVEKFGIKEFDINMLKPNHNDLDLTKSIGGMKCAIIGGPNSGKSCLARAIMYAKKEIFPVGVFVSGSEDSKPFYSEMVPSTFIHNDYDEEIIKKFVTRQKIAGKHLANPWAMIILDDCINDRKMFNSVVQHKLWKIGRHQHFLLITILHYALDFPRGLRACVDVVFMMRDNNIVNRKSLYDNFATIIPDFNTFCEIMDQITGDFTAMVITKPLNPEQKWQDCVFWIKAKEPPKNFKFGAPEYWKFHDERYNPEYVDPIL